jgi:Tfp pilus assembly protein PilZ
MAEVIPISYSDRCRTPRHYLGGAAELIDLESGQMVVALVRVLSSYGCFIKTGRSFRIGSNVMVKVTHSGTHFSAKGRIVNCLEEAEPGIGIEFTDVDATDRQRIEEVLGHITENKL